MWDGDDDEDVPGGGEVVELAVRGEDDDADVGVAEDGELPGFLEQPGTALAEGHLPVHRVLDAPQLHLASRHGCRWRIAWCLALASSSSPIVS